VVVVERQGLFIGQDEAENDGTGKIELTYL